MQNKLPEGATPGEVFVRKEVQCMTCTHYKSEHMEHVGHCAHVMYYFAPEPDLPPGAVQARQLCSCKEFVPDETDNRKE